MLYLAEEVIEVCSYLFGIGDGDGYSVDLSLMETLLRIDALVVEQTIHPNFKQIEQV